jgi:hypothetical protein
VSGSTVTIVGAGSTTITASQAGNSNYEAAPDVMQTLTVSKASQTITFTLAASVAKSDSSVALNGTASSGLAVQYNSSNQAVAGVSGSTLNLVAPGSTTVTASQSGDSNYNAATPVDQTIVVTGPIAASDSVARQSNTQSIDIAAATLLANDTRVASDGSIQSNNLTITGVTSGVGNSVSLFGTVVSYTPADPSATAPLTFTYTVSDGSSSDVGTVTVATSKLEVVHNNEAVYDGSQTSITVQFASVPNQTYTIQYTTDLTDANSWTSAGQWSTTGTGSFAATITASGDHVAEWNAHMFFRGILNGP